MSTTAGSRHGNQGRASRWLVWATLGTVALFATGTGPRPAGVVWDVAYDAVLYHLPYLTAAAACALAARRVARERTAWLALGLGLALSSVGDLLRAQAEILRLPSWAAAVGNGLLLVAYVTLYVTLVALIRARVPRFHPSMWLDGVIAALGTTAVGVAFLLGPRLAASGTDAAGLAQLAWPAADVLLLALLVAVGAILGIRLDRTVVLVSMAMLCTLAGDIVFFGLPEDYELGGPLDLTWLASMSLVAVAARLAAPRPRPADDGHRTRIGWRVLALPLACNLASLLVLAIGWGDRVPAIAGWSAIACVVAALVRTTITFRELRAFNEVREQARTDELTGLPNRRALLQEAERVLTSATASRPAALLLLDLDGFKEVNDGLGHHAGDQMLRQVGARIGPELRAGELLARLGGDEFAVLLPGVALDEASARAERMRELILQPFPVEDIRLHVGVSIGVATAPVPAASVRELLRCADVAMYEAKRGREGVHVYVPDPQGGTGDRLRTMEELRAALTRDELEVRLQPQVDLGAGTVVGVEALVRWRHPARGLLSPADLLPAAEQAGLMRALTDQVLELALAAASRWWGDRRIPVSVNLSAANVTDLDLPAKVEATLARFGLPADALTLELVEDTLMADPEHGRGVLAQLRRLGVRTSIDDYGTGYSSLAYLRHLPADELKLDRSLTADVDADPRAAAIVRHTVALAHELGLRLVAEGVEDAATAAVLAGLGCDVAQGYAVARPMPADDFLAWLDTPRPSLLTGTPA